MKILASFVILLSTSLFAATPSPVSLEMKEKLYKIHKEDFLKNLEVKNPTFFILFSGTQGMGKTFVSRKLEEEFKGVRISSNVIRSLFEDHKIPVNPETVHDYLLFSLQRIMKESPNHFLVLDTSMDRSWGHVDGVREMVESYAKESQQFWIRLHVPQKQLMNNLRERNDYGLLKDHMIPKYIPSWELFGTTRKFDIELTGNVPYSGQLEGLMQKVREKRAK